MCVYIYIYICLLNYCVTQYIYIYRERERERARFMLWAFRCVAGACLCIFLLQQTLKIRKHQDFNDEWTRTLRAKHKGSELY